MLTAAPVRLAPLAPAGLEYTKGESQTNIEVTKESDFSRLLEIEEEFIKNACDHIIVRQLRHHFWIISRLVFSSMPPHTRRSTFSTRCPCVLDADWHLQSNCMTDTSSGRQARRCHHREGRLRPGAALPRQARHHRDPPGPQVRQQPDRPGGRRRHRQPLRRGQGVGRRHRLWAL